MIDTTSGASHGLSEPGDTAVSWVGYNPEYDTTTVRYHTSSLVTPWSVVDYDMVDRTHTVRKVDPVLGDFDPGHYTSRRAMCPADDGTEIPISIVHRSDLDEGPHPTWLYAYGSYGIPMDPTFSINRLSLLDRNVVYAIAHVRGGGDMGRGWYEDGKLQKKKNTFTDFIDCAEHLVDEGYTTPEQLVIEGRSAGGLLIGTVINMAPQQFRAAHAGVPFVDVVTTMLDATIPLTTDEWDEWGDPREKEFFETMLSYSPYDQVRAQDYPAILVTSGLNDSRVQYWEPTKWTARLRDLKTDDHPLILKTQMGAGHGGASGRYGWLADTAFEWSFLLDQLGLADTSPVESTVVYLVRHAEKERQGSKDPALTDGGESRARALASRLSGVHLTGVHSTDTRRTRTTAAPTAGAHGLEVELYDPRDAAALVEAIRAAGGNHLVVGHSNTTPALVEALGGDPEGTIEDTEYDRLYRVVLTQGREPASALSRYGK